jgi:hypothetical protein
VQQQIEELYMHPTAWRDWDQTPAVADAADAADGATLLMVLLDGG